MCCKNCYNLQKYIPIQLKFGAILSGLKANISTNFTAYPIKIQGVINVLCVKQNGTFFMPTGLIAY